MKRFCFLAVVLIASHPEWASMARADDFAPADQWYARMREPWKPAITGFMREWMILGEFPNPPRAGETMYNHQEPCTGCDTDYLVEHGGETNIHPVAGMTHKRPDGSEAAWIGHVAPQDTIDFTTLFGARPHDGVIAYAFTTLQREQAGPAILAIGSDDGVMVWVNGKRVHRNIVGRAVVPDNDIIPIDLVEGENEILLKVEQGTGGWGFCCRLLDEAAMALPRAEFNPVFTSPINAKEIIVKTDALNLRDTNVLVEVVQAGGKIMASDTTPRGDTVKFKTENWPDGCYEIRCALTLPLGQVKFRHLPWFKGDLSAAVSNLLGAASQSDDTPSQMIISMLGDMVRDRLGGQTDAVPDEKFGAIFSPLLEFEELSREQNSEGARARPLGFVRLAYRDEIDGSPQFARAYLPPDYDPAKKWPLVVYLHGYSPPNPDYIHWWAVDARHQSRAEDYGVIYVEAHGRGNTAYLGIGDRDVMRCVQLAKEQFAVDEDRVYLTGESMGGGGTWHVGTRHPEVFAAIAPIYGGWDFRATTSDEDLKAMTPRDRFNNESWSSIDHAEALLNTPAMVSHGDSDDIVDVRNSRFLVEELQRWHYDIRYAEYPGGGHFNDMGHWPVMMKWLLAHRRDAHPLRVRVRSPQLKDAAAHWVRIEQKADPYAFMNADAEIVAPNMIRLDTENVLAITLSPGGEFINPDRPLRVIWNAADVRDVPMTDGKATLHAASYHPAKLVKRPHVAGPLDDVQQTPYAIVYGTISDDARMRIFCERQALGMANNWKEWQKFMPRLFKDVELPDEARCDYSLILVGGPEANQVTRDFAKDLPFTVTTNSITLDGHVFTATNAAVQFVYPHPMNSNRYVLVMAANSADGMYFVGQVRGDEDFVVTDGRTAYDARGREREGMLVGAGRFNYNWRVVDDLFVAGDARLRKDTAPPHVPQHINATVATNVLYISDVLDLNPVGSFTVMRRDRNFRMAPLQLGGRTYAKGLSLGLWEKGWADWDLSGGNWRVLRGIIGLEFRDDKDVSSKDRDRLKCRFIVQGDGKELYRSDLFVTNSAPREIEVPIAGVTNLTLMVHNEAGWTDAAKSVDWADLRLERK